MVVEEFERVSLPLVFRLYLGPIDTVFLDAVEVAIELFDLSDEL